MVLNVLEKSKNITLTARWLLQVGVDTVNDGVLNSNLGLIGELEGVQEWLEPVPKLLQDKLLHGLHDVGGQCHGSVVFRGTRPWHLWHRNEAGRLP